MDKYYLIDYPWYTGTSIVYAPDFSKLTVIRLEELSVFTQYLFHSDSNNLRSRPDLK